MLRILPLSQLSRAALTGSVAALIFFFAACSHSVQVETPDLTDSGITRGKNVGPHETAARSVVALISVIDAGQALCSGTLLSDDTVLTAAHCVDHAPSKLVVVFSPTVQGARADQMRAADAFTQNPRWLNPTASGRGDLALVHFRGGIPDGYQPVKLAPPSLSLGVGMETLMLGYGVTDGLNHVGAGTLREMQTTVIGRSSTTEVMTDGKKSSVCFGDSGGPAFIVKGAQALQWGVASSVANQACNQTSLHTELRTYLPWLRSAAGKLRARRLPKAGARDSLHQEDQPIALDTSSDSTIDDGSAPPLSAE